MYKKEDYIAIYCDTAFSGIGIIEIIQSVDDYVKYQGFVGKSADRIKKAKIKYGRSGEAYINVRQQRLLLSDFIKTS